MSEAVDHQVERGDEALSCAVVVTLVMAGLHPRHPRLCIARKQDPWTVIGTQSRAMARDDDVAKPAPAPAPPNASRRCSQASRIRLGTATTTQITKNSGHPVAFAT